MGKIYDYANQDLRTLLGAIGVGPVQSTLIIRSMWIAPATTDLDSAAVIMLVQALQRHLIAMGAPLEINGELDLPTARAIEECVGAEWQSVPWAQIVQLLVKAREAGYQIQGPAPAPGPYEVPMGIIPELPAMPGGLFGWAVLGAAAFYFFRGRRAR